MGTHKKTHGPVLPVEDVVKLELFDEKHEMVGMIENRPGQKLSLSIYHQVAAEFGGIGPAAARRALELYGEHAEAARAHPGTHPNIDRLFRIIAENRCLTVKTIPKD